MLSLVLALVLVPQDLVPAATAGVPLSEGSQLVDFLDRNSAISNVTVALSAPATTAHCDPLLGEQPWSVQFGTSRRLAGPIGFVLANGWVEDLDDDGMPIGNGGCASAAGLIGVGTHCDGADPTLAALLDAPAPTLIEGARLDLGFDVLAAATLWIDWNFVTFENPADASFFDAFGIVFDDGSGPQLLAGGTSSGGPAAASFNAGWALAPSPTGEFQDLAFPGGFHLQPARQTGRRRIELALAPGLGQRLSFHVADSGPTVLGAPSCAAGAATTDPAVHSFLAIGSTIYAGPLPSGTTPGVTIDVQGHPGAPAFPGDLALEVAGNLPGSTVLLVVARNDSMPVAIGALAPWSLLVELPALEFVPGIAAADGIATFPFPADLSAVTGDFFAQGWSWQAGGTGLTASPGLRLLF